ncbi:TPA: PIN domain-containing protein [Klebsiella pneumoniae]
MSKAQLEYGAISIDSNIMHSLGYRFDAGMLKQLKQFKNKHVVIIQPRIIHNEMIKHVSEPFVKLHGEIEKIQKDAIRKLNITEDIAMQAANNLKGELSPKKLAENIIESFYSEVNGKVLDAENYVTIDDLVDLYFICEPPFENNKDKKNEFPDAIALLTLDSWAAEQKFKVVAVSEDRGWKNFAKGSANLEVVDDLQTALAIFQPHQRAIEIIESLLGNDFLDEGKSIYAEIKDRVSEQVSDIYYLNIDASSAFMFDYDDISVEFNDMKILKKTSKAEPIDIVRIDENEITLSINVEITCSVEANFSFYVEDSIDRDMVSLGYSNEKTDESFNTVLLVKITGDFSGTLDDIELLSVEMQSNLTSASFGSVAPYYRPEEEDEYDYYIPNDTGKTE